MADDPTTADLGHGEAAVDTTPAVRPDAEPATPLHDLTRVALPIAFLVGCVVVGETVIYRLGQLDEAAYFEPSILAEVVRARWPVAVLAVVASVAAMVRWRTFGPRWPTTGPFPLRLVVVLPAAVLTWAYTTYDYNLYFDRGHAIDRILLLVLFVALVWRPVFVPVWLVALVAVMGQFAHPLGGYSLAEQSPLIQILVAFIAVWVARAVIGRWLAWQFLFVALCIVASTYWWSGVGKLRLGWIGAGPHVNFELPATYSNGWLGFVSEDRIGELASWLGVLRWPMAVGVLVVELGALLLLVRRWTLTALLVGFVGFHLAVFGLTGILFWKWMAVEIGLLVVLLHRRRDRDVPFFDVSHAIVSVVVIGGSFVWFAPSNLSWYDAPATYVYRLEATGNDGRVGALPPGFFGEYSYQFTLSVFEYLVADDPRLGLYYGAMYDREALRKLRTARTAEEVFAIEAEHGLVRHDAGRAERFERFVATYVGNWNERRSSSTAVSLVEPPSQLITFDRRRSYDGGSIETVTVTQVLTFFDGERYAELREVPVLTVTIDQT